MHDLTVTKEVMNSSKLSPLEKMILAEIIKICKENHGVCTESNSYFSVVFDRSRNRCSEIITSLVAKGYVKTKVFYRKDDSISHREIRLIKAA